MDFWKKIVATTFKRQPWNRSNSKKRLRNFNNIFLKKEFLDCFLFAYYKTDSDAWIIGIISQKSENWISKIHLQSLDPKNMNFWTKIRLFMLIYT